MYEQIASNQRASFLLMVMCLLLLSAVGYGIGGYFGAPPEIGVGIAVMIFIVWSFISYFGGKKILLWSSRAKKVDKKDHPQLFNVVEEMSIAAGLPMPEVYLIDDTAPNAFATGRKPEEAAIAVTSGLLQKLNRDELQGVIAHEMAHIKNRDTLFAMLMAVMVGSIALVCDFFWKSLRYSGRRRSGGGNAIFFLIALALAIFAPIFAKLIELAMSRRREFLADATGALLTRYPEGLASALEKIAKDQEVLEVSNRATQHLYIVNPIKPFEESAKALFSTHPPIDERIRRLRAMAGKFEQRRAPVEAAAGAIGPAETEPGMTRLVGASAAAAVSAAAEACPRCGEALWHLSADRYALKACRQCGGVLVKEDAVKDLLRRAPDKLGAVDDRFPNRIGFGWARVAPKRCPYCGEALKEQDIHRLPGITVDRCLQCGWVWFDDGELSAVVAAAKRASAGK